MKREILFRGKLSHSDKWIEGNLLIANNDKPYIIPSAVLEPDGHHLRIDSDSAYWIIPETIGQFTGLTDKNGVKIFEGDIIKYTEHSNYLLKSFIADVSYKDYLASFSYLKHGLDDNGFEQPLIHFFNEVDEFEEDMLPYIEVIGNIHDNPELINK